MRKLNHVCLTVAVVFISGLAQVADAQSTGNGKSTARQNLQVTAFVITATKEQANTNIPNDLVPGINRPKGQLPNQIFRLNHNKFPSATAAAHP